MNIYIVKNSDGLKEFGHAIGDLEVIAETEQDADNILNGGSGCRAWNKLRDRALATGYDIIRPATDAELKYWG